MPWGIAEVSFHPSATRAQEEPMAAGQRLGNYTMTNCFRGPRTDDFNLEGKLSDTVHFNTIGLTDHAQQWANALGGVENLTPKNGNFEGNTALADGVTMTSFDPNHRLESLEQLGYRARRRRQRFFQPKQQHLPG